MTPGGAGGSGSGGGAPNVFLPPGQPGVASALGSTIQPLLDASANGGAGTPAGQNYGSALNLVQQYLSGSVNSPNATPFNDASGNALLLSKQASDYGVSTLFPQAVTGSAALNSAATGGLPYASTALQQGFDPTYGSAISMLQNNPFYAGAQGGAQQGAGLGAAGANQQYGMAGQVGGTIPGLLNSGFDPQQALFNRSQGQLMDQTNAINSMSGLAGTPYGASVGANAMGNFDINWQNQQLARQAQATGAAGTAAGQAGSLYGSAPGLAGLSAAMPGNVYTNQIGQILSALGQRNAAGTQGATQYNSLLGSSGGGLAGAAQLGLGGANALTSLGSGPYQMGAGIANNAVSGLTNATMLGNSQYNLPNQEISNMMQYLGLGQNASQMNQQLSNSQFGQTAAGLGGLLGGANTLFGGSGFGGSGPSLFSNITGGLGSALGGIGSLFGGGGAAAAGSFADSFPAMLAAGLL